MTSHPPISSTSWHLSLPAGGGLTAIFFFVVWSLITPQVVSAQNAPKANALIVWQASQTIQDVAGEIVAFGGRVDHIFPPNAAIVYVPSEKMADLKTRIAELQIHQGAVELGDINQSTDAGPIAAAVWNAAFMKASAPPPSRKGDRRRRAPPNDVRIAPDRQTAFDGSKLAAPVASSAPGFFDTSAYLIGSMTVGIITPESNGSGENWSSSRQNLVVAKIVEGLQWWKDNALAPANLTFVYDIHHSVATTFEPITLSSSDEDLWISQVMSNLGYPGSSNQYFTQVRNYLNDKRNQIGTDWAFAIFIADSNNDNDGSFLDGSFAYAYLNGPFMVLTYDNDGWGINDSEIVIAHEHGHIWGALDEYASSGCTTSERSGYLNVANTNCEAEVSDPAPSIMGDASVQEFQAFPNHLVSLPARQMVGWRDSDGDGKERYDPVDTTVTAVLTHFSPDPTMDPTPTYTGYAFDTPFVSPTETDVTINFITSVEFRVDGGPWQLANATDGAFDEDVEDFQFAPVLTSGTHTIQVRATNSVGNVSPIASDTLTAEIDNALGDFDGDGRADIAVYRTGTWFILRSSDGGQTLVGWGGAAQDIPVQADYDGDGKTDQAVYRDGAWFIRRSTDSGMTVVGWGGSAGDVLVPADYDGDGKTDIAIYRSGAWFIVNSSGGTTVLGWGGAVQDVPVPADYDGDGKTDVAVYRDGAWFIRRSTDSGMTVVGWGGAAGDLVVPADYDGDGKSDVAIYRSGAWFIVNSSGGTTVLGWGGAPQDVPVPADYDGDGKADVAVYRDGAWFIRRSTDSGMTVVGWGGVAGDIPLN